MLRSRIESLTKTRKLREAGQFGTFFETSAFSEPPNFTKFSEPSDFAQWKTYVQLFTRFSLFTSE